MTRIKIRLFSHPKHLISLPFIFILFELDIFTIQKGDSKNPAILMIHGYPTSSYDFKELFDLLSKDYYVCAIDTPGYGFSDKPRDGYRYSIEDDAKLIDYYIKDILKINKLTLLTHDKGNSVGLALLGLYQNKSKSEYIISHHIITNGNIYLPLANLTGFQKILLSNITGPLVTKLVTGDIIARALAKETHNIEQSKEEIRCMASVIDYQNGGRIQYDTIQYLNQRKKNELNWLKNLEKSNIPTTIIWGEDDKIAPLKVADYVWDNYLKNKSVECYYWRVPDANHYIQNDKTEILAGLIRHTFGEELDAEVRNMLERRH